MAAVNRAYTTEYTYVAPSNYAEEFVRQIPKKQYVQEPVPAQEIKVLPEIRKKELITQTGLLRAVISLIIIGALLIGTVWMSATATEIKYSINKINKENVLLEDEIEMLNIKIESSNSIAAVEAYAIDELNMKYPAADQCIYIEEGFTVREDLAAVIKQKAYN